MKIIKDKIIKPLIIKGNWSTELIQFKESCLQLTINNQNLKIGKDSELMQLELQFILAAYQCDNHFKKIKLN